MADKTRWSARVQHWAVKFFVDVECHEYPYHGAWYDTESRMFYDMNVKFRKIPFEHYQNRDLFFFESPVVITKDYLESMVGKRRYGIFDVVLFGPAKMLGFNLPGDHCTEALNDDIWFHGGRTPWTPYEAPPSPCEMLKWASQILKEVKLGTEW